MNQNNYGKRLIAVHDLSSQGRVALMVVIPILSVMGIQVNPLPTALLSASTNYKRFRMTDLTGEMTGIIEHWKEENQLFDAIYTGFLGSEKQIEIVIDLINNFKNHHNLIIIDPVLGDKGRLYSTMNDKNVIGMRELLKFANVITPNLTEVCLLLQENYHNYFPLDTIKQFAIRLSDIGPSTVVITGVNDKERNDMTSVVGYTRADGSFFHITCEYIPSEYPGTGDIFTSVFTGCLLQGCDMHFALQQAVDFTLLAIKETYALGSSPHEGAIFEKVLYTLAAGKAI